MRTPQTLSIIRSENVNIFITCQSMKYTMPKVTVRSWSSFIQSRSVITDLPHCPAKLEFVWSYNEVDQKKTCDIGVGNIPTI